MDTETLKKAVDLAEKIQHIMVATADSTGKPHVATALKLKILSDDRVAVEAWFCPGTVINLGQNHKVALVVWDPASDNGYQLIGKVEKIEDLAILNGYTTEIEELEPSPQVERQLEVRVDSILVFSRAPHSDLED